MKQIVLNISTTYLLKIKLQKPIIFVWVYFNYTVNISKFHGLHRFHLSIYLPTWDLHRGYRNFFFFTIESPLQGCQKKKKKQDENKLLLPDLTHTDLLAHAQKSEWKSGTKNWIGPCQLVKMLGLVAILWLSKCWDF